jgi:DNA-binding MarR family transcriptional regulator
MPDSKLALYFGFFNEIGIIGQLSSALLEKRLPKGLLVSHFSVLNHLVRVEDGRTPLDLARAFQVPKTTMSHTLSVLEKRGLVALGPNPRDARSKLVWLTDAGRQFRDDAIAALEPDMAILAEQFSAEEIEDLSSRLRLVREFLDRQRDPNS